MCIEEEKYTMGKKNFYESNSSGQRYRPKGSASYIFKRILSNTAKVLVTIVLVGIITGCIVITSLTVYVMKYIDTSPDVDIRNLRLSNSTLIYANDTQTDQELEIQKLYSTSNRLWTDINQIPKHVIDAFIYTEDERFFQHEGVDWKRTFAAFANLFLNFYDSRHGGSTITQQLIKNVTGESQVTIDRKIQEIFKAMNLERYYSKNEILEGYLNIVHMANNTDGIGAASIYYFNKSVTNLNVVEGAALAAMTRSPSTYDPIKNPSANKERRVYVLGKMLEFDAISKEDHDKYITQDLVINKGGTVDQTGNKSIQSYFVDNLINEVVSDLSKKENMSIEAAESKIYNGGLRIYSTMDPDIQKIVESKYNNNSTFAGSAVKNPPQSAMVVMNYSGKILGLVGGRGEKKENRIFNRATQAKRSPGSTMKPIGVYSLAFEKNVTTWSTINQDSPIQIFEDGVSKYWPKNYDGLRYGNVTTDEAIQRSLNTVPVKLLQKITTDSSFDFLKNKLGITTLVENLKQDGKVYSDNTLSGFSLGGLTHGLYLHQLTAAYQIYGNKGTYYKPVSYTKVLDAEGKVLLENKDPGITAISEETAGVMNRLLKNVVDGPYGTGKLAKLPNTTVIGKTGTSEDEKDQLFVGGTPSYLAGLWLGYDNPATISRSSVYAPPQVWKNIMSEITKNETITDFVISDKAKKLNYCTVSGLIAKKGCYSKKEGYYKQSYIPNECNIH